MSESLFFRDLAVMMSVVGLVSVVFTRLGWPKVIGYLLAGILMSEHTWGGSFLADPKSIGTIGQLGIVFLMFTLGLEFSADDMKKVKHVAVPTAIFDTLMMIWLGYTVGTHMLGWGSVESLFLGAALCDSATTLLAKTIEEMRWGDRPFVRYIFGTTIFEDILCVGVIALVTGVANGKGMNVGAVGMSLGGLIVFFTGVLVFGLVLAPRLLDRVALLKDDETLLLTLLGLCCRMRLCGMIGLCDLEQTARIIAAAHIADHGVQHRRCEHRAHDRKLLGDRIENADCLTLRRILRNPHQPAASRPP